MSVVKDILMKGHHDGVFPGAVLLVALKGEVELLEEIGYRSIISEQGTMTRDTIFDLASLTKVLATMPALMKLVGESRVGLDQPIAEIIRSSPLGDKEDLTPRLILSHSAGFADWKPFYLDLVEYPENERKNVLRKMIIDEPFAYSPGKDCIYSDLGFMVLEWVIEEATGTSLASYVEDQFYKPLSLKKTFFGGTPASRLFNGNVFAATEDCPWRKKVMCGEVDDENAFALGGYSGHAGLFGTAEEVYLLVNMLREHYYEKRDDFLQPETVREFFRRQKLVEGSTWALGWDTPTPEESSAGKYFSSTSLGHLGFTGTSIWVDLEKDVIIVLLTNRVHPSRENQKIKEFRPRIHDAVMSELGLNN